MTHLDGRPAIEIIYRDGSRVLRAVVSVADGMAVAEKLAVRGAEERPSAARLSSCERQVRWLAGYAWVGVTVVLPLSWAYPRTRSRGTHRTSSARAA